MNKQPLVDYQTQSKNYSVGGLELEIISIENLDHAIDQICELLDPNDPLSEDLSPYFGTVWDSSIGLINYLESINYYPLNRNHIEIGCGLALPSFWITKKQGQVLATDSHPDVSWFLKQNQNNNEIFFNFQKWNWRTDYWTEEKADVIIGSDILYESRHPKDVILSLKNMLNQNGRIFLSDPGRGYLQIFHDELLANGFKGTTHIVSGITQDIFVLDFHLRD